MANLITIGRLGLLFITIALIYTRSFPIVAVMPVVIAIVFLSDGLDGFVARRRGSTSEFGAVLDIAGDRVVENALWIVSAHLGLIGVWAPLLVVTRGFFVDTMRGVGYTKGKSAFGENTMARTPVTRFLTASRFMRAFYGIAKGLAFVFLFALFAARLPEAGETLYASLVESLPILVFGWFMVYASLALTVIRGVPVLIDAIQDLSDESTQSE
ncbi:MAG: CDP-alcohol phosphatidyltransferase family protein [Thermomicrobiaceae bacterium]